MPRSSTFDGIADFIPVTTLSCLKIKDCTDQGLYNLLVYWRWEHYLPHTKRLIVPMEGGVLSYTLGHLKGNRLSMRMAACATKPELSAARHTSVCKGCRREGARRNQAFSKLLEGLLTRRRAPLAAAAAVTARRKAAGAA